MWIDEESLSKQQLRKLEYILKGQIMAKIKVKVLNEECMPIKGHRWDAGWDLKAAEGVVVPVGETVKVHTGVIFEIPVRHVGIVVPRSSVGAKHRVTLANDVGVIDAEYRGEIILFLANDGEEDFEIKQFDRFAQLMIIPINTSELWPVTEVSKTGRGDGGFGSTDSSKLTEDSIKVIENMQSMEKGDSNSNEIEAEQIRAFEAAREKTTSEKEETPVNKRDAAMEARLEAIVELQKVKPSEYLKLQKAGKLFEVYPIATGNMQEDLGL